MLSTQEFEKMNRTFFINIHLLQFITTPFILPILGEPLTPYLLDPLQLETESRQL